MVEFLQKVLKEMLKNSKRFGSLSRLRPANRLNAITNSLPELYRMTSTQYLKSKEHSMFFAIFRQKNI